MTHILQVLVPTPAHSNLRGPLSYTSEQHLPVGTIVKVPLGKREVLGVVYENSKSAETEAGQDQSTTPEFKYKEIISSTLGLTPLGQDWLDLVQFTSQYYQRSMGEVAIAALPSQLKSLTGEQIQKKLNTWQTKRAQQIKKDPQPKSPEPPLPERTLSPEQDQALRTIQNQEGPFLLFGATGSGKTEVYLKCMAHLFKEDPHAQVLIMVPEINLTPQLEKRVRDRFLAQLGAQGVVTLHSELTPAQRLNAWLAAHFGQARIILGTRMSIFASIPHLRLIVVDEEHDPSYKQQEGARYSARDLAVYRASITKSKVILGSATPSLESWYHCLEERVSLDPSQEQLTKRARYIKIDMPSRIGNAQLPELQRVDMNFQPKYTLISEPLLNAMREKLARQEQILVLLNRRGYSPVLYCSACGWKSQCTQCTSFRVFHKSDRTLRCHHCGDTQRVPQKCPTCANQDINMLGIGTERLEESLREALSSLTRKDKGPVRVLRIDADSTKTKDSLRAQLDLVHEGEVDVLIGTQMIAKGHDFRRVTMVAALEVDSSLFSNDFRSTERLFSLLMQAAGRSGRDADFNPSKAPQLWVQTFNPQHPLFQFLKLHDYPGFAQHQLLERQGANMPPFSSQALIKAESRSQENAQKFLHEIKRLAHGVMDTMLQKGILPSQEHLLIYSPIPMSMRKVANVERAQLLIESQSRKYLQLFLSDLKESIHQNRLGSATVQRWVIDIDPQSL